MHFRLISKNTAGDTTHEEEAGNDLLQALSAGVVLRHKLNAPYQVDVLSVTHDGAEHKLAQLGGFHTMVGVEDLPKVHLANIT